MNFTKSILSAAIYSAVLLAPSMAFADNDPETFQTDKEHHIAQILKRIQIDQKNLSCVQAAQDNVALKACDETAKQDHDILEPKVEAPFADKKAPKNAKNKEKK